MEEIKLKIAKEDGFDSWEMMLKCYSTTYAGIRVIDKHITKALNMHVVGVSEAELVFKAYGKPFTSGRDLWDWINANCEIRLKN